MNTTEIKRFTKAQEVEQVYYNAALDYNISSEGCYGRAVDTAQELGGVETYNSNNGKSSGISFAPTLDYTFDDGSRVQVTYGSVFVI